MNDQGRKAPAYMIYPAARMADLNHRQLSLAGRGLRSSLEDECWVNNRMPADPEILGKVLGYPAHEVRQLLPEVMPFFAINDGFIVSPELENYRAYLLRIRTAQSEGGKRGSGVLHKKRGPSKTRASKGHKGDSVSDSQVTQLGTHDSLIQSNSSKTNSTPSLRKEVALDPFVVEYVETERVKCTPEAYKSRRG